MVDMTIINNLFNSFITEVVTIKMPMFVPNSPRYMLSNELRLRYPISKSFSARMLQYLYHFHEIDQMPLYPLYIMLNKVLEY